MSASAASWSKNITSMRGRGRPFQVAGRVPLAAGELTKLHSLPGGVFNHFGLLRGAFPGLTVASIENSLKRHFRKKLTSPWRRSEYTPALRSGLQNKRITSYCYKSHEYSNLPVA